MRKSVGTKTFPFPLPVWAISTYDTNSKANVMVASWGGICCSNPPCLQVSIRKETSTYANLIRRKAFIVNIPTERYVKELDYFGMISGKMQDKFVTSKLTPVKSETVDAPYIEEFPVHVECRLMHNFELGLHTLFVGEIADVKVEENLFSKEGKINWEKIKPFIFAPEFQAYYSIGQPLGEAFKIGADLIHPSESKMAF